MAAVTIAELREGVELSSGRSRTVRQTFLDDVVSVVPVIDYDARVAEAHAHLLVSVRRQGRTRGAHDLIIAATALASNRTVLTADRSAFVDLPGVAVARHR
jgi:tRNA(fMet)-specific endonuclease VapC